MSKGIVLQGNHKDENSPKIIFVENQIAGRGFLVLMRLKERIVGMVNCKKM